MSTAPDTNADELAEWLRRRGISHLYPEFREKFNASADELIRLQQEVTRLETRCPECNWIGSHLCTCSQWVNHE